MEVVDIFKVLDLNGDGELSHAEFIRGLKANPMVAKRLGMPTDIRAEDGTRDNYQLAFGKIDNDGSKVEACVSHRTFTLCSMHVLQIHDAFKAH